MRLYPTISFEQYRETCRALAAAKPKGIHKRTSTEYVGLVVVGLSLGFLLQFSAAQKTVVVSLILLIVCWISSKPLKTRSQDRYLKTIFDEEQESLNNQVLTIDEAGITCNMRNGKANSFHDWAAFVGRIDLPDAYIFLPSPNSFIRIPTETLSPADRDTIRLWCITVPIALIRKR